MVTKKLSLTETSVQNLLTPRAKSSLHTSEQYYKRFKSHGVTATVSGMKTVQKIWKDKIFKYVLSMMGVSKESISKFLIGNRFHAKLRILSPENCKQSLQVKSWKAEITAEKKQTQDYNQNFVIQAHKS